MTPVAKAFWLAVANVVAIAIGLTIELPLHDAGLSFIVVAYGFWPGALVGYLLGNIAQATAAQRPIARLAVLALPACSLVVVLGALCHLMRFVPHACIPTLVAAAILERTTRTPSLVPPAVVA